jgi:hypothetical protein
MVMATMPNAVHLAAAESLRLCLIASIYKFLINEVLKIGKKPWLAAFCKT